MNDRRLAALDRKAVDISSDTEKARELKEFKLIDKRTKIEVDKINKADRLKNRIKALQNRNDEKLEISEYIE